MQKPEGKPCLQGMFYLCVVSQLQGKDYHASFPSEIKKRFWHNILNLNKLIFLFLAIPQ